jgi:hypothetical protein
MSAGFSFLLFTVNAACFTVDRGENSHLEDSLNHIPHHFVSKLWISGKH